MKTFYLISFLIITTMCRSQSNELSFDYDSAGNQTIRELICVNCDESANRSAGTFLQSEYNEISYFPNPVEQELFIQWELIDNSYITSLQVFSLNGQLLISKDNLSDVTTTSISFSNASQGVYNVVLFYSNGEKKSLKVIKK